MRVTTSARTTRVFGLGALLVLLLGERSARAERRPFVVLEEPTPTSTVTRALDDEQLTRRARARLSRLGKEASAGADLVRVGIDRFGDGESIVRFAASHQGLPVIGQGATVRLSPSGEPRMTVLGLDEALPDRSTARVSAFDAARVASGVTPLTASENDAHLVVWPTLDRGPRLAWVVMPRVPTELGMMPRIVVDAVTREVLQARDLLTFAKANVFASNPIASPNLSLENLSLTPDGTSLSNPFLLATNCIDKKSVKALSFGTFNLSVHVCDLTQTASPDASGNYLYDPSDVPGSQEARSDAFSEVSMYYHASKAYAFFRALQNDAAAQVVVDKPLRVIANLQIPEGMQSGDFTKAADPNVPLAPFQNAFFAPASGGLGILFQQLYGFQAGALWFGQGPTRDYSYDGDVVYHELTHAVVDATLQLEAWHADARGAIDAPGAMNEALADYFSSAITGDPKVGEYAAGDMGLPAGEPIRTLGNQDTCSSLVGEVHEDSTAFSGGLWSARSALPEADRSKFDAALYKAMRSSPGSGALGFESLIGLFVSTLKTELPAGATALEAKMTERGLLPACERIVEYRGRPIASRRTALGFAAPGKQSVKIANIAPGILQVRATLPANAESVEVSFRTASPSAAAGLGGGGRPFTPVVLAKFDAPIEWNSKLQAGHDATHKVTATTNANGATAAIQLAEGSSAATIYLQIANTGDLDGAYDGITLNFTVSDTPAGAASADPSAAPAAEASGCSTAHLAPGSTVLPAAFGVLSALALRRRRKNR